MSKYPAPELDCPRCGVQAEAMKRVKVGWREVRFNDPDRKILERSYRCKGCGRAFWHEVAAKEI